MANPIWLTKRFLARKLMETNENLKKATDLIGILGVRMELLEQKVKALDELINLIGKSEQEKRESLN